MRRILWLTLLVIAAVLLLFGGRLVGWWVEWLWFGEVGQRGVYWRILGAQAQLALLSGISLAALMLLNLLLARRGAPPLTRRLRESPARAQLEQFARIGVRVLIVGGSLVVGLLGATEAATHWEEYLLFRQPQGFGIQDPIFGRDVGFYVFTLPFLKYLYGWSFVVMVLVTVATAAVYYSDQAIDLMQGRPRVAVPVRVHLSILLGILALIGAWGYRLEAFDLLFKDHPRYVGAGYTDVHAHLPALNILTVVALIAALGFFANVRVRALWLPGAALAFMLVASLTIGGLYPGMVQRLRVQPNEANLERPYIENHLRLTRAAFGLEAVRPRSYTVKETLSPGLQRTEAATLENIRLWDYRALVPTYRQLQGLRDYYDLSRVDIDRYPINGRPRQVMLAARELNSERLANPGWVNQTLQFTHGYGLVMNPVIESTASGQPRFVVGGLPLKAADARLLPRQPQIYYGEATERPVIAPSSMREFDFDLEQGRSLSRFEARTGLSLGSTIRRSLLALYLGDSNVLLSNQITSDSRLLIRRRIDERAARIAPFLRFDHDPYLVVGPDRLYWIQDAYTASRHFPYSRTLEFAGTQLRRLTRGGVEEAGSGFFNYLRNSVKVVVDAYSGETRFYVFDERDPLVRAYRSLFPGLFEPADRMPAFLRAHVRYPEDLFTVQARILSVYHVEDPIVFYNRTAFWDIPREALDQREGADSRMEPYYVMMRLPGEKEAEYVLIQPFVFRGQQNMAAWLAARCEPDRLGDMRLFTFDTYVRGPQLIDQAIQSKPEISSQLTLLNREGSRVIWGNLLVLPLGDTLLYVRPLYLAAATADHRETMREFQRVVVAHGEQVIMAPSLASALNQLYGAAAEEAVPVPDRSAPAQPAGAAPTVAATVQRHAVEADQAFTAAREALGRNDWTTFGQQMQRAQRAIRDLRSLTGTAGPAPRGSP